MSNPHPTDTSTAPFHDWLLSQADRDDAVGDLASDYRTGTELDIHKRAGGPDELIEILHEAGANEEVIDVAEKLRTTWNRQR